MPIVHAPSPNATPLTVVLNSMYLAWIREKAFDQLNYGYRRIIIFIYYFCSKMHFFFPELTCFPYTLANTVDVQML